MARKKSKKDGIILIIFFIVIIIAIYFFINNIKPDKAKDLLKEYMGYIEEQKYDEMYELLSDESKEKVSKEKFIQRNKNIYEGINVKNINLKTIVVNKDENKIKYQVEMDTIAGNISFFNEVSYIIKNENYYINWNSSLIYPDLSDDDKIRVEINESQRGKILDRNNNILAEQGTVSVVGFVPGKIKEKESAIKDASKLLNVSTSFIEEQLEVANEDEFVPIKTMSNEDEEKIESQLLQIKGIMISSENARVYPYNEICSHLIGYATTINSEELAENKEKGYTSNSIIGKTGIEKIYEDKLRGTNEAEIYIVDANENKKKTITKIEKKDGANVKLTIDINIQTKIYNQLKEDNGLSVAINPKTGEILAMVSTPCYNPNDFVIGFSSDEWEKINIDKNNPLFCRYQSTWVPGSSFKPIIGAIGLTTGKFTADEDFGKSGLNWQKSEKWGDYKISTLQNYKETANLKNALIYSDNIYFAKAALKIGDDLLAKELFNIGFNQDIPNIKYMEQSKFSSNNKFSSEIQLADTGYGQGKLLINPLHMASMYSAFVNDGNMLKPYIEYSSEDKKEYWIQNAFSKEAANEIKEDLIQVVEDENGTAHEAKIDGITIAGKTGTAEIKSSQDDKDGTEIGWFNCFRVTDRSSEQLLIVNMIQDVKNKNGSHYLLPKVRKMFE